LIFKHLFLFHYLEDVNEIYKQKDDYVDGIVDIFVALAAKSLGELSNSREISDSVEQHDVYIKQIIGFLESADSNNLLYEYTWIIKGFFEIIQGCSRYLQCSVAWSTFDFYLIH
jgi:hypothetical protein